MKMRAQMFDAIEKITLREIDVPAINDDEVLIKVKYCGICGTDWSIYTGKFAKEYLPFVPGHEIFGIVEEVGKNAKGIKKGDRVAVDIVLSCGTCYFCRRNEPLLCQSFTQLGIGKNNGGFAEYFKAPWKNIYHVPDSVDDLSATMVEPLTATLDGSKKMDAKICSSIAIIGCGLGIFHACLAKLRGCAPVILIGDHAKRLEIAKQMNAADYYIDINKVADPVAEVMKITGGVGVDYAIEAVGSSRTYEQAFSMLRRGGKLEAFGICAGDDYAKLRPFDFVLNEKKISGSTAGVGNDWGDALTLLQYKRIDPKPMISMIVPLEELPEALFELRNNTDLFKVLVSPDIKKRQIL